MNHSSPKHVTLLSTLFFAFLLLAGHAIACPATYVKAVATSNQGTALYEKSAKVADKYMANRGMDPLSSAAEITRPYVIGTTLVENRNTQRGLSSRKPQERIDLNRDTVDETVRKALGPYDGKQGRSNRNQGGHTTMVCWHHFNRHFGNGMYQSNNASGYGQDESQQRAVDNKPG